MHVGLSENFKGTINLLGWNSYCQHQYHSSTLRWRVLIYKQYDLGYVDEAKLTESEYDMIFHIKRSSDHQVDCGFDGI